MITPIIPRQINVKESIDFCGAQILTHPAQDLSPKIAMIEFNLRRQEKNW